MSQLENKFIVIYSYSVHKYRLHTTRARARACVCVGARVHTTLRTAYPRNRDSCGLYKINPEEPWVL